MRLSADWQERAWSATGFDQETKARLVEHLKDLTEQRRALTLNVMVRGSNETARLARHLLGKPDPGDNQVRLQSKVKLCQDNPEAAQERGRVQGGVK